MSSPPRGPRGITEGLRRYPEYKPSSIGFLGDIPEHWEEKRAKYFYREVDERSTTGKETLLSVSHITGVTPRSQKNVTMFMAESTVGYKICRPGDLAINTMWAWMGAMGASRDLGLISPAYGVYRPWRRDELLPGFVDRLLRIPGYVAEYTCRSTGIQSSRLRLYPEEFLRIPVPCPPPDEQAAIVRFLDRVDRRIRRYVRAKKKLIILLEEQKQVIIHRAVTRGIDPNVRMKASGVQWLGDVPEHWQVMRLRLLFRYKKGSRAAELTSEYIGRHPGQYPVYSGQTENQGLMGSIDWHEFDFPDPVVFVTTVGARAMSTRTIKGSFSLSQNCALIIPRAPTACVPFFELAFRRLFEFERASISLIMQPSLRFSDLNRFVVPVPPQEEQRAIAAVVGGEVDRIERSKDCFRRQIIAVEEFRSRLSSDVVTGKLDIRAAAAVLPEELDEPDEFDVENEATDEEDPSMEEVAE